MESIYNANDYHFPYIYDGGWKLGSQLVGSKQSLRIHTGKLRCVYDLFIVDSLVDYTFSACITHVPSMII